MPAIEFSRTHSYLPADDGISLPVFLNNGAERVKLLAHVDTVPRSGKPPHWARRRLLSKGRPW